ncbi:hypothetical protein D3C71_1073660 [compost metagenome]|jgi:hypothetical protein
MALGSCALRYPTASRRRACRPLALCRQKVPEVEICLFEVPLSQQNKGLYDGLYAVASV